MSWWSTSSSSQASRAAGWGARFRTPGAAAARRRLRRPGEARESASATTAPTPSTSAATGGMDPQQQLGLFNFCVQRFPDHLRRRGGPLKTVDVEGIRSQLAAQGLDPDDPGVGAPPGPTLDPGANRQDPPGGAGRARLRAWMSRA